MHNLLIGVAIVPLSLSAPLAILGILTSPLSVSTASRTTNEQPSDTDSYSGLLIYPSATGLASAHGNEQAKVVSRYGAEEQLQQVR